MAGEGITWAPDVTCDLTQRYLVGPDFEEHLRASSRGWLRSQAPEALIAWLAVEDEDFPDGWRAELVAALDHAARP